MKLQQQVVQEEENNLKTKNIHLNFYKINKTMQK